MISFFKKIMQFGLRRLFVFVLTVLFCKLKSLIYRTLFSDLCPRLMKTKLFQPTQFVGKGEIYIGAAQLGVWPSPGLISCAGYIEARSSEAKVVISDATFINNNFTIIADRSAVFIHERCLIGPNFFVSDSDFHGLELENRTNGRYECSPVIIESDVFIGEGVKVLKGVRIGSGAVIGSGSVVVRDVEPYCIYAGVPAKKIKSIQDDSD